ncbi:PilZ domain-containing protein [Brevundimonas sp. UBA2416]|uniref:PilZ domain-containing protein n=1 Tax=Brevundimonas sp. UBA2416 TaxID=1946124 RepID=UPI0025B7C2C9|nr:PilZ domain-containing protein [Brevundimonas sp. UBA2416]HRJ63180.1 PilZ domain-containing protein [Brevundimonas sp.]
MTAPQDRRFEPRSPANVRAVVVAPGFELPCQLIDQSAQGCRIRLDRNLVMPKVVMVIDIAQGVAIEAQVAWQKGLEAGLKRIGQASLRGLTPSRLSDARAAWIRAGGR